MKKRDTTEIDGVSYAAERELGRGGAAEVWRVHSSADDRAYALKQIKKVQESRRNERFRREIEFGTEASNDHVVRIHASKEDDEYFYYVMELYTHSLRDVIDDESDFEVLLDYLHQLCEGLLYVHREEVVHRDIKPENILVNHATRRLVLADFGIAHFKDSSLTQRGDLLVNRNYLAPEQMAKRRDPGDIGKPADIFALGLIMTEAFTKQNSRGIGYRRVAEVHPFLAEIDELVEKMMLQDPSERVRIEAVRDSIHLIRMQIASKTEEIGDGLRDSGASSHQDEREADLVVGRASKDVLSAKYIFERVPDEDLSRYNANYHCEIGYRASAELYNACVQSKIYMLCKRKFEYEAGGGWSESDTQSLVSPLKVSLLQEFESIQQRHPLPETSTWGGLPRLAAHYFRFCKDYHCREILRDIQLIVPGSSESDVTPLHRNLVDAPILWIALSAREYLETDIFEMTQENLEQIEFEHQVGVHWEGVQLQDPSRTTLGADLLEKPRDPKAIARILRVLGDNWNVSYWQRRDGNYWVHFDSRAEFARFRTAALELAARDYVFEGDVLHLLETYAEYDNLVALIWSTVFDIPNTLAKVLGLREI